MVTQYVTAAACDRSQSQFRLETLRRSWSNSAYSHNLNRDSRRRPFEPHASIATIPRILTIPGHSSDGLSRESQKVECDHTMPQLTTQATKATRADRIGTPTKAFAMLPSAFLESEFADDEKAFVIVVLDTGESAFDGMHKDKAGKEVKAKFVVVDEKAEGGRGVAPLILHGANGEVELDGEDNPVVLAMSNGEHKLIPLGFSLYMQAIPPNVKGTTIDEALNRKTPLQEAPKQETKAA